MNNNKKIYILHEERIPCKDTAGIKELQNAINFILKQQFCYCYKAIDIFCLFILMITGMKISNLFKLKVKHVQQLIEQHKFDLELIKNKKKIVQTFFLPTSALNLFQQHIDFFKLIIKGRDLHEYVLSQSPVKKKSLDNRMTLIIKLTKKFKF